MAVAVAAVTLSVAGLPASPASASAYGCTLAPGYASSWNCIDVQGSGLYVDHAISTYDPGLPGWPPIPENLCDRYHQIKFQRSSSSTYTYWGGTITGCIWGFDASNLWFIDLPNPLKHQSQFCGRTRNTHTDGVLSNWACITIHS
jgi:hypothetical protein